jgi:hypothetical protein
MVAHTKPSLPPCLDVHAHVSGYTVTERLTPAEGNDALDELLAVDSAGACVVLRVALDPQGAHRMRTEASLAQLHLHDGIVQSIGVVEVGGWPVQVLEHIDGIGLDQLALIAGGLPAAAVSHLGHQVALVLAELHGREPVIAHGALAAERIVVDMQGNARLRDLGRLRPQQHPRSVSPERRMGSDGHEILGPPTVADDLYALGILLVEAALGHPLEVGDVRLLDGVLPERLFDAVTVLLGPAGARLTNAGAAVRIFSELEGLYGDGQRGLRVAVERVQLGDIIPAAGLDEDVPITEPDGAPVDAVASQAPSVASDGPFSPAASDAVKNATAVKRAAPARRAVPSNARVLAVASAVLMVLSTAVTAPVWLPRLTLPSFHLTTPSLDVTPPAFLDGLIGAAARTAIDPSTIASDDVAWTPASALAEAVPVTDAIVPVADEAPRAASAVKAVVAARRAHPMNEPKAPAKAPRARSAPAKASAVVDATDATLEPAPTRVKLAIDGVSEGTRVRVEASLRSCGVREPTVGVVDISGKVTRVTTDPSNGCVERMLKRSLHGLKDSQPFELTPK